LFYVVASIKMHQWWWRPSRSPRFRCGHWMGSERRHLLFPRQRQYLAGARDEF
jgi:hypothetical protein